MPTKQHQEILDLLHSIAPREASLNDDGSHALQQAVEENS